MVLCACPMLMMFLKQLASGSHSHTVIRILWYVWYIVIATPTSHTHLDLMEVDCVGGGSGVYGEPSGATRIR